MNDPEPIEHLMRASERLLRVQHGSTVRLSDPTVIDRRDRSLTLRCAVSGWDDAASVVIKSNHGDDERGFSDWASFQFLSGISDNVAPCFYAGDDGARFFVMEDLGASRSLEQVFSEGDESASIDALRTLAVTMARLVVDTIGQESRYLTLRRALPGATKLGRGHEAALWLDAIERVKAWASALGMEIPANFEAACEAVARVYADPGPWLAFSHGDPAPSNNNFSRDGARLIDFEYAGYRHALYDLTAWDTLCPVPKPWLNAMRAAYRDELRAHLDGVVPLEDEEFRRAWGIDVRLSRAGHHELATAGSP